MPKQTCLHLRAGVRARDGNRLANQVLNTEILRVPTPLCLAERLAGIYSLFKIFGYVFEKMVPPHGSGFYGVFLFQAPCSSNGTDLSCDFDMYYTPCQRQSGIKTTTVFTTVIEHLHECQHTPYGYRA